MPSDDTPSTPPDDGTPDLHLAPHRVRLIEPLGDGWVVTASAEDTGRHWRMDLARGEDPAVVELGCWVGDEPAEQGWGIAPAEVASIVATVTTTLAARGRR